MGDAYDAMEATDPHRKPRRSPGTYTVTAEQFARALWIDTLDDLTRNHPHMASLMRPWDSLSDAEQAKQVADARRVLGLAVAL